VIKTKFSPSYSCLPTTAGACYLVTMTTHDHARIDTVVRNNKNYFYGRGCTVNVVSTSC